MAPHNFADSTRQLQALGLPYPQAKAQAKLTAQRPAMAIEWYVGHEPEAATSDGNGSRKEQARGSPEARKHGLEVRTLGALMLRDGEDDLTPVLLRSRVHSFIWLYLLMRAIANPRARIGRVELADELTPGLATDKQRKRLRNRLSDLLAELPPPLKGPIKVEDDFVRFDISACSIDVVRLFELAHECAAREGLLSEALDIEVDSALIAANGEFLPGWDEIEGEVNGGRGAVGDVVQDLRVKAEDARIALLAALANNHLARREPARAIPVGRQ